MIRTGTLPDTSFLIETPIIGMKKSAIVSRGIELGAPFHLTWSCYQTEEAAGCRCEACALRRDACDQAGGRDPLPFRSTPL